MNYNTFYFCYYSLFFFSTIIHGLLTSKSRASFFKTPQWFHHYAKSASITDTFDLQVAVALGGYSFQAYNEASSNGKVAKGLDRTQITFTSTDFIKRSFDGVLLGTARRGEFNKQFEEQFVERLISGDEPDVYLQIKINDTTTGRIVDSFTSTIKTSKKPSWNESFALYIMSPKHSSITITAMDKDYLKSDDILGEASIPLSQLLQGQTLNNPLKPISNLPVPMYLSDAKQSEGYRKNRMGQDSKTGLLKSVAPWLFKPKMRRSGTAMVDLQYISFGSSSDSTTDKLLRFAGPKNLPVGATAGLSWGELLSRILGKSTQNSLQSSSPDEFSCHESSCHPSSSVSLLGSLQRGDMLQMCSVENTESDTQSSLWADFKTKQIVVSFRGTEQIKIRDILTDINLQQARYKQPECSEKLGEIPDCLVHSGFLSAFQSVLPSLLQLLSLFFSDSMIGNPNENGWTIYITGHSLGGALATLLTFDLGRLQQGYFSEMDSSDPAHKYMSNPSFVAALRNSKIITYTFGAPRVGCPTFSRVYNSMCRPTFRVVNSRDIVARMPRSSQVSRLLEYEHVGRTVLLEDTGSADEPKLWVEGESDGACPLSDLSPFVQASASSKISQQFAFIFENWKLPGMLNESYSTVSQTVSEAVSFVASSAGLSDKGIEQLNLLAATATDAAIGGVDQRFLDRELALLQSIVDGTALENHLEPSYHACFDRMIAKSDVTNV